MGEAVADGLVCFHNDDESFLIFFPEDSLEGHDFTASDDAQQSGPFRTCIGAAVSWVTPRSMSRMMRSEISCQREEMMKQALLEEKPMITVSMTLADRKIQISAYSASVAPIRKPAETTTAKSMAKRKEPVDIN